MKSVRELQTELANGFIQRAIKQNILSITELIYKKRQCPLSTFANAVLNFSITKVANMTA